MDGSDTIGGMEQNREKCLWLCKEAWACIIEVVGLKCEIIGGRPNYFLGLSFKDRNIQLLIRQSQSDKTVFALRHSPPVHTELDCTFLKCPAILLSRGETPAAPPYAHLPFLQRLVETLATAHKPIIQTLYVFPDPHQQTLSYQWMTSSRRRRRYGLEGGG